MTPQEFFWEHIIPLPIKKRLLGFPQSNYQTLLSMSKQKSNLNLLITGFGQWAFDGKTFSTPIFNAEALPVSGGGPWKKSLIAALGEPAYEAFKKDLRKRLRASLEANIVLEGLKIEKKEDNFFVENGPLFTHLNEIAVSQSVEAVPELSETQHNLLVNLVPALAEATGCPADAKWGEQITHLKGLVTPPADEAATEEVAEEAPTTEEVSADAATEQPVAETEAPAAEEAEAEEEAPATEEGNSLPANPATTQLMDLKVTIQNTLTTYKAAITADAKLKEAARKLEEIKNLLSEAGQGTEVVVASAQNSLEQFQAQLEKALPETTTAE